MATFPIRKVYGPNACGPCQGSGWRHSIFDPCGCEPECTSNGGQGDCGGCGGTGFAPLGTSNGGALLDGSPEVPDAR